MSNYDVITKTIDLYERTKGPFSIIEMYVIIMTRFDMGGSKVFKFKIDIYAVDRHGRIIMEPRRQECFAFTKHSAIRKSKDIVSSIKKVKVDDLRILNVETTLF